MTRVTLARGLLPLSPRFPKCAVEIAGSDFSLSSGAILTNKEDHCQGRRGREEGPAQREDALGPGTGEECSPTKSLTAASCPFFFMHT